MSKYLDDAKKDLDILRLLLNNKMLSCKITDIGVEIINNLVANYIYEIPNEEIPFSIDSSKESLYDIFKELKYNNTISVKSYIDWLFPSVITKIVNKSIKTKTFKFEFIDLLTDKRCLFTGHSDNIPSVIFYRNQNDITTYLKKKIEYYIDNNSYTDYLYYEDFINISYNIVIKIYNSLFKSVLSGEYIFHDEYTDKLKDLRKEITKIPPIYDQELAKYGVYEYTDNKYDFIFNLDYSIRRYFYLCRYYDAIYDEVDSKFQIIGTTNLSSSKFNKLLSRISNFGINYDKIHEYGIIPEYLFDKLTEISIIDLNFIVGDKELEDLVSFDLYLEKVIKLFNKHILISEQPNDTNKPSIVTDTARYFNKTIFKDFNETLKIAQAKTKYLIKKIIDSDKENVIGNYRYLFDDKLVSLSNTTNNIKSLELLRNRYDTIELLSIKYEEYEIYIDNIKNKEFRNSSNYSVQLSKYLNNIEHHEGYKDISNFNKRVILGINNQLLRFGKYINELDVSLLNKERGVYTLDIEYANKITTLIDRFYVLNINSNNESIRNFFFISKHTDWAMGCLEKIVEELKINNSNNLKDGYVYARLLQKLRQVLFMYKDDILKGVFCFNDAVLFNQCFFSFSITDDNNKIKLSRVSIDYTKEVEDDLVFIASSYRKPISKFHINDQYEIYSLKIKDIVNIFYNQASSTNIVLTEQTVKNERKIQTEKFQEDIDETKRSLTQTLGIFAALIGVVTSSVSALKSESVLKPILGITLCLTVFIIILHHTITSSRNKKFRISNIIMILISVIILFVLLLVL